MRSAHHWPAFSCSRSPQVSSVGAGLLSTGASPGQIPLDQRRRVAPLASEHPVRLMAADPRTGTGRPNVLASYCCGEQHAPRSVVKLGSHPEVILAGMNVGRAPLNSID
ncbi:MAG TPA: hypothetical protein VF099_04260 [Ktedonobacterales bacterium]